MDNFVVHPNDLAPGVEWWGPGVTRWLPGVRGVQEPKGGGLSGQEARLGAHGVKEWPRS